MKYYDLHIGEGLGLVKFNDNYNQIINLLGKPDKIHDEDVLFALRYNNLGLSFYYDKGLGKLENLSIISSKINYKNKKWSNLKKNELFEIIKTIYKQKKYKFEYDFDNDYIDNTQQYEFYKVGISLFFKNNILSEVSLSKPIID